MDLSPDNIVLRCPDGANMDTLPEEYDVYIVDMGSAKLAGGIDREVSVTFRSKTIVVHRVS